MINLSLFRKELLENRIKFYLCFFVLAVAALTITLLYDYTRDILQSIDISRLVDQRELDFIWQSYDNYAWSQWTAKNLTQLATLAAIIFGMGSLAGEHAYGTTPFLLSKPISRRTVYRTKAASGIFLLIICLLGPSLIFIILSQARGFPLDSGAFMTSVAITTAGAAVIYMGTMFFSALMSEPVRAGVAAAVFWAVVSIPGFFKATVQHSLFYQMKAVNYWIFGASPWWPLAIFLFIGVILFETGLFIWSRREF